MELSSSDLDAAFTDRVNDIAAVFGAFPDTSAVLYATAGLDPCGVIVETRRCPPRRRDPIGCQTRPASAVADHRCRNGMRQVVDERYPHV